MSSGGSGFGTNAWKALKLLVPTTQSMNGGRGGIRTRGEFNPTFDFESSALNRAQPPFLHISFTDLLNMKGCFACDKEKCSPNTNHNSDKFDVNHCCDSLRLAAGTFTIL